MEKKKEEKNITKISKKFPMTAKQKEFRQELRKEYAFAYAKQLGILKAEKMSQKDTPPPHWLYQTLAQEGGGIVDINGVKVVGAEGSVVKIEVNLFGSSSGGTQAQGGGGTPPRPQVTRTLGCGSVVTLTGEGYGSAEYVFGFFEWDPDQTFWEAKCVEILADAKVRALKQARDNAMMAANEYHCSGTCTGGAACIRNIKEVNCGVTEYHCTPWAERVDEWGADNTIYATAKAVCTVEVSCPCP